MRRATRDDLLSAGRAQPRTIIQWFGLLAGPVLAIVTYQLLPGSYESVDGGAVTFAVAGRATAAVGVWMATWWLTEAVEIPVTALLPLVLLPLTGATDMEGAAAPYAHPLIFLFLGGFLLARSMQRWGLDERIALVVLGIVGERPRRIIGGFMLATAVMSMWVSNTATVAMMLPIAMSVSALLRERGATEDASDTDPKRFPVALLLGIACAASIGGMGTIIGTPPNLFVVSFIRDRYDTDIAFVEWMLFGLPLVAVFLPLGWLLLTRVLHPVGTEPLAGAADLARGRMRELGPISRGERITLVVFTLTALAWMTRPLLSDLQVGGVQPLVGLTDTGIAIAAALALFVLPVDWRERRFTLDWESARDTPWGVLILFGGGLSLASAIDENGVSEFLGSQVSGAGGLAPILLVAVVATGVIFLTELTSNTATTAALVPILAGIAPSLGIHPFLLIVPVALAASAAFMMPVATPPNAIVFGSGELELPQMLRAGIWMNLLSILLVTVTVRFLVPVVLGVEF